MENKYSFHSYFKATARIKPEYRVENGYLITFNGEKRVVANQTIIFCAQRLRDAFKMLKTEEIESLSVVGNKNYGFFWEKCSV